jgi:ferredoxin
MRISVNLELCIGAGQCVLVAPAIFDQDEHDGLVRVLPESPSADAAADIRDAVALCPSGAIALTEDS